MNSTFWKNISLCRPRNNFLAPMGLLGLTFQVKIFRISFQSKNRNRFYSIILGSWIQELFYICIEYNEILNEFKNIRTVTNELNYFEKNFFFQVLAKIYSWFTLIKWSPLVCIKNMISVDSFNISGGSLGWSGYKRKTLGKRQVVPNCLRPTNINFFEMLLINLAQGLRNFDFYPKMGTTICFV